MPRIGLRSSIDWRCFQKDWVSFELSFLTLKILFPGYKIYIYRYLPVDRRPAAFEVLFGYIIYTLLRSYYK